VVHNSTLTFSTPQLRCVSCVGALTDNTNGAAGPVCRSADHTSVALRHRRAGGGAYHDTVQPQETFVTEDDIAAFHLMLALLILRTAAILGLKRHNL